ncbi:hypothetical protein NDU88_000369 [Pleurodeles waltl]|uniref:Uncharacterized protein n=1 Tax=Pleurodeles waltl TaxID=8319 RepID=A0AAV7VTA5_PLEWA|nr:hypothetical protein NDU88_000369 [Pleurodeles waltl]
MQCHSDIGEQRLLMQSRRSKARLCCRDVTSYLWQARAHVRMAIDDGSFAGEKRPASVLYYADEGMNVPTSSEPRFPTRVMPRQLVAPMSLQRAAAIARACFRQSDTTDWAHSIGVVSTDCRREAELPN